MKVDSEESLNASTEKFIDRFRKVEELAKEQGIELSEISIQDMDKLWKQAKKK